MENTILQENFWPASTASPKSLQFFSIFTVLIFGVYLLVQIRRMKNEEAVLSQVYPEYPAYQARTARLIPKVY